MQAPRRRQRYPGCASRPNSLCTSISAIECHTVLLTHAWSPPFTQISRDSADERARVW